MARNAPRQPLKKSVQGLRAMREKLEAKMKADAEAGQQRNEERESFVKALADAEDMMKDYLNTGAPALHWHQGQQKGLFA